MSTTSHEPDFDLIDLDDTPPGLLARVGAEIFASFVLVLLVGGALVYASINAVGTGTLGVAVAAAAAVAAAGTAVSRVSGGHLNPAVTLGLAVAGRFSWRDVLPYWLAQLVGAALAGLTLFLATPQSFGVALQAASQRDVVSLAANGFGANSPLGRISEGAIDVTLTNALIVQAIAAAVLVGVFLGVTGRRSWAANPIVLVGLVLGGLTVVTVPLTNGGINPAYSFGIALFSTSWALSQLWLFALAPLVGAVVAGAAYRLVTTKVPPALIDGDQDDATAAVTAAEDAATPDTAAVDAAAADASADVSADEADATVSDEEPEAPRG